MICGKMRSLSGSGALTKQRRKLAAILSADVAGYSRLMEDDERATVETLTAYRESFADFIERHDGRVVDSPGDNLLAEFASPVEAVACAIEVQAAIAERNTALPAHRHMEFRIGINLGDVIEQEGALYGDGVNLAARLEGLAEPGGVWISEPVHMQVEGKLDLAFDFLGEHTVKNLARPVRVYGVRGDRTKDEEAAQDPVLPGRPSIAVLAFTNLSGDPEQEFFADGIAEDLITALSGLRWLFVTARNSTFTYKGSAVDVKQVGRELGVRYVLEGSVRKGGNRVRISAQLIDATTGNHVWAQRYDRELADIFAVQDEITESIVSSIEPELGAAERERARRKTPDSLDAWECFQRGLWHFYRFTGDDNLAAQELFRRAADLDPGFSLPLATLGWSHLLHSLLGFTDDHEASKARAREVTRAALRCDEADPLAHTVMCRIHFAGGDVAAAIAAARTALGLNPNLAITHFYLGHALSWLGEMENALAEIDEAIRLSPRDPFLWVFETVKAGTLSNLAREDEAVDYARKAVSHPGALQWAYAALASSLGHLGKLDEARAALAELLRRQPDFSPAFVRKTYAGWPAELLDHYFDGLRKAGLDIADEAG
jgi:adenylate cyclase